jgi:hypothetical protein
MDPQGNLVRSWKPFQTVKKVISVEVEPEEIVVDQYDDYGDDAVGD